MGSGIASYRDLEVWQKAMDLAVQAYRSTRRFPKHEQFALATQVRRAVVSVPSNIAEGHGRSKTGDYLHHLSIAHGSLMEFETQVMLANRLEYLPSDEAGLLLKSSGEVGRMLHGLIPSLKPAGEAA